MTLDPGEPDLEVRRNAPALDDFEASNAEALRRVASGGDVNDGRRTKQHDSPLSAGQEGSTAALISALTAEREAKEATARDAREQVLAQRLKRETLAKEIALAFEEPRVRDKLQRLLHACEIELKRRERVADAAAEAAAAALTSEVKYRDGSAAFGEIEARKRQQRDSEELAELRQIAASKVAAAMEAEKRAQEAVEKGKLGASDKVWDRPAAGAAAPAAYRSPIADIARLRWQAHEAEWSVFAARRGDTIALSEIPMLTEKLVEMGLVHCPEEVDLKVQQSRWHPDRWQQKFGAQLVPEEREEVFARVAAISAYINGLRAEQNA